MDHCFVRLPSISYAATSRSRRARQIEPRILSKLRRHLAHRELIIGVPSGPSKWAAKACLGMDLRHEANAVSFRDPVLPAFLDHVTLNQLSLGNSRVDLKLQRHGSDVTLNLLRRQLPVRQ
jgi:hypothetical protein